MADVTPIGFLGLGQMGAPMAERLLAGDVRLPDRRISSR
jgi:3-hydroxyisobutyrate dehydrogenase-like beta-hydroxyacid dehydrogenase